MCRPVVAAAYDAGVSAAPFLAAHTEKGTYGPMLQEVCLKAVMSTGWRQGTYYKLSELQTKALAMRGIE